MSHYPKGPSEAFHETHGGDCVEVKAGEFRGYLVYSNGAMRERSAHGCMNDPPSDPLALAKVQLAYREELLRRAMEDFDECKEHLKNLAISRDGLGNPMGAPPFSELERLERLAEAARLRQADYDAAQKRVDEATPAHVKRRVDEHARRQRESDDFLSAIRRIKV